MKKCFNLALGYAIAAMVGGVFYREFTKFSGFSGRTTLGFVHTHLFLLGMVVFLLTALFVGQLPRITQSRAYRAFLPLYNIGVPVTALMLAVRGIAQVRGMALSRALDASISGIAGIGHILTGVGLILLLVALRGAAAEKAAPESVLAEPALQRK